MKSLLVTATLVASAPAFAQAVSTEGECGGVVRVTSSGLTGGGSYVILKGDSVGGAVVPGGPCAGVASGLSSSGFTFYGPFSADSSGSGELAPTVPVDDEGAYLQVLDLTSCRLSSATDVCSAGPAPTEPSAYRPVMVVVPSGSFFQGCTGGMDGDCWLGEDPPRVITLTRSYWMSETEVTQGQFESLMGYSPSYFRGYDRPVEELSWHEAAAYSNALSELEGLPGCYHCSGYGDRVTCEVPGLISIYECSGYRLPTEAEWEHAARCGTDLKFAGSDELGSVGWYSSNSGRETQEVGGKLPNGCGLYDMSGNVWELANDWYDGDYYGERPTTDPEGPTSGTCRVLRGGSWSWIATTCRVSYRSCNSPTDRVSNVGFRISRTIP